LIACLRGEAEDAAAAQAVYPVAGADGEVVLGIQGEQDSDLLALLEGFAGGLVGGGNEELDLAEIEFLAEVLWVEWEDLFDDLQDGLGNEGRAFGALFDASAEEVIKRLGIEAFLTLTSIQSSGADHMASSV
jgi:hypothetical protein